MRPSALPSVAALAVALAAVAACGGDSSGGPTVCNPALDPTCDQTGNKCINPVVASEAPPAQILLHETNVRVGQVLPFTVPPNTASVTIVEQAVSAPATVTFKSSASSAGQTIDNFAVPFWVKYSSNSTTVTVYDDNLDFNSLTPDQVAQLPGYAAGVGPAIGTLTIPNTTGGLALLGSAGQPGLPPGNWSVFVSDVAWECTLPQQTGSCTGGSLTSTYDVTVIAKPASSGAIPSAGTLDIVFHFATTVAGGLTLGVTPEPLSAAKANAGQDQDLNRMIVTLKTLLGKAGITVGSTSFSDLPASVQSAYALGVDIGPTDACSPLAELLKNGKNGKVLNVFFVSDFFGADIPSTKSVVGLDGTIPGPSTFGSNSGSGVAVSTVDLRANRTTQCSGGLNLACGADQTAYYIAHETGHYLGLYHPTEMYGYRFDPLIDTPMCACSTCKTTSDVCATSGANASSTSHTMSVSECTSTTRPSCGGGDNLMFWTLGSASKGNLSADQKRVILANPLVQ